MVVEEESKVNIDKQHRICDKQGRPLRFKSANQAPFHGHDGKPNPRQPRLDARRSDFDNNKQGNGRKRPGSLRK